MNPLATESNFLSIHIEESVPLPVVKKGKDIHFSDKVFSWVIWGMGALVPLLLIFIGLFLYDSARPALSQFGWNFLSTETWDPVRDVYGVLPVIFGTLFSSFLALCFAVPLSIGVALFITEWANERIGKVLSFFVEMLAAIPSVVYGLWGIFVLAPWLKESLEPPLIAWLGFSPFFQGPAYGVGMLAAGMILAVMIIPTISSISREVFLAIPREQREGALALGATRWEMVRLAVLKSSRAGMAGAIILGLGRALGETMAVTMVIGNRSHISLSLFAPGQTMASVLANEYVEATSSLHLAALAGVGLILFALTFGVNLAARIIVARVSRGMR